MASIWETISNALKGFSRDDAKSEIRPIIPALQGFREAVNDPNLRGFTGITKEQARQVGSNTIKKIVAPIKKQYQANIEQEEKTKEEFTRFTLRKAGLPETPENMEKFASRVDPFGQAGIRRMTFKAIGTLAKGLTKVDDVAKVTKILTKNATLASDEVARIAPTIAKSKNATTIKTLIEDAATQGGKTRGFVETVTTKIGQLETRVGGQYIPRSTDKLAIKARNLIKTDIETAKTMASAGTDDKSVAVASELINHYNQLAQGASDKAVADVLWQRAADVVNELAPKLTEQGRSIQAAAIFGRLTPEGTLRFAAREIQKYNEVITTGKGGLFGLRKAVPEITAEQTKLVLTEADKIYKMPDSIEKAMAIRKLQDTISGWVPSPTMHKVVNVWKAGLLTGIKTSGLNTFSNLFHGVSEIVKDVPAVAVDSVASLFTGKRTIALTARGTIKGTTEGFAKGWRFLKTGYDERNLLVKLDYRKVNFGSSKFAKGLQKYEESIFRMLGAEDQPFYYGAKARSLYSQALAQAKNQGLHGTDARKFAENLILTPTDEMLKYAVNDAEIAVFQNKTVLGTAARGIQKLPGGELIVPFGRTPAAVGTQIINYSPVGAVKTIVENIGKGRFDQKLFAQGIGRGVAGTLGGIYVGQQLQKKGLITLGYPKTERERAQWQLEGKKPNSILVGGKWRSVAALGPAGFSTVIGGYYQSALDKTGSPVQALGEATAGAAKSLTETTFLSGLNQALEALNDPSRFVSGWAKSFFASWVPTIVADIAKSTDPLERKTNAQFLDALVARVPYWRESLEPQIDVLGQERPRIGNFFEVMADPTRPSPAYSSELTEELRRLMDAGFPATPTFFGPPTQFEGITPEENTAILKRAGQLLEPKLYNLIQDPKYIALTDDEKSKLITSFADIARDKTRVEFLTHKTKGIVSTEELKTILKPFKDSGLVTKPVFQEWLKLGGFNF